MNRYPDPNPSGQKNQETAPQPPALFQALCDETVPVPERLALVRDWLSRVVTTLPPLTSEPARVAYRSDPATLGIDLLDLLNRFILQLNREQQGRGYEFHEQPERPSDPGQLPEPAAREHPSSDHGDDDDERHDTEIRTFQDHQEHMEPQESLGPDTSQGAQPARTERSEKSEFADSFEKQLRNIASEIQKDSTVAYLQHYAELLDGPAADQWKALKLASLKVRSDYWLICRLASLAETFSDQVIPMPGDGEQPLSDPAGAADEADLRKVIQDFVWLFENDPCLVQAIEEFTRGMNSGYLGLNRIEGRRYETLLGREYETWVANKGTPGSVEALHNVDELLRGILPRPLPHPTSWWCRHLDLSKRLLREAVGDAQWMEPEKTYTVSPHNWHPDKQLRTLRGRLGEMLPPGESEPPHAGVLWVLRYPFAGSSRQDKRLGRLIYAE